VDAHAALTSSTRPPSTARSVAAAAHSTKTRSTLTDIVGLLDALDPWLQRHLDRWISEEQAADANCVEDDYVVEYIDHDPATRQAREPAA
jgi:hypothetical protein